MARRARDARGKGDSLGTPARPPPPAEGSAPHLKRGRASPSSSSIPHDQYPSGVLTPPQGCSAERPAQVASARSRGLR